MVLHYRTRGFCERMFQVVKQSLRKSVGRSILTASTMETLLIECEAVVNGRPLTYVSDDLDQRIITPAHFLSINPKIGFPASEQKHRISISNRTLLQPKS